MSVRARGSVSVSVCECACAFVHIQTKWPGGRLQLIDDAWIHLECPQKHKLFAEIKPSKEPKIVSECLCECRNVISLRAYIMLTT